MAIFNPDVGAQGTPNWTGASGGPVANRAPGVRLENLANNITQGTNIIDTRNQRNIRQEAQDWVTVIQSQYGVEAATADQSTTLPPSLFGGQYPSIPGLDNAKTFLENLHTAWQTGQIRESHYYAQLNNVVRGLKSRYPGYGEVIDNTIRDITGITPANSLVFAIQQEALQNATSGNSYNTGIMNDIDRDRSIIASFPGGMEFLQLPVDEQIAGYGHDSPLRAQVAGFGVAEATEARNQALVSNGQMTANDGMTQALAGVYERNLAVTAYLAGDQHGENRVPTPEEFVQQVIQMNPALQGQDAEAVFAYMRDSLVELRTDLMEAGLAYPNADRALLTATVESYMAPMEYMVEQMRLGNEDAALLADHAIQYADNVIMQELNRAFGNAPAVLGIMNEIMPQWLQERFLTDAANLGNVAQWGQIVVHFLNRAVALGNEEAAQVSAVIGAPVTTNPDGTQTNNLTELITNIGTRLGQTPEKREEIIAEIGRLVINDNIEIILNDPDPDDVAEAVNALYANGGLDLRDFPVDERHRVYSNLTNEATVQAIQGLGNPDLFRQYTEWAIDNFGNINRELINEINNRAENFNTMGLTLTFNTATGQFMPIQPNRYFAEGQPGAALPYLQRQALVNSISPVTEAITLLNTSLSAINPVLEANNMTWQGNTLNSLLAQTGELNIPVVMVNNDILGNPVVPEGGAAIPASTATAPAVTTNDQFEAGNQVLLQRGIITQDGINQLNTLFQTNPEEAYRQQQLMMGTVTDLGGEGGAGGGARTIPPEANNVRNDPGAQRVVSQFQGQSTNQALANTAPSGQSITELARTTDPVALAQAFLGSNERDQNATLSAFFRRATGSNLDPATTAWCAQFANAVLQSAGYNTEGVTDMARSFLNVGQAVETPARGDVVVLSRGAVDGPFGHVGFFMGYETQNGQQMVRILGGNQGDSVSEALYSADRVLGYRRLEAGGTGGRGPARPSAASEATGLDLSGRRQTDNLIDRRWTANYPTSQSLYGITEGIFNNIPADRFTQRNDQMLTELNQAAIQYENMLQDPDATETDVKAALNDFFALRDAYLAEFAQTLDITKRRQLMKLIREGASEEEIKQFIEENS